MVEKRRCAPSTENDLRNRNVIAQCSNLNNCYDNDESRYSNDNCPARHSCAKWTTPSKGLFNGCVITKYCGTRNHYYDELTTYECPEGRKAEEDDWDLEFKGFKTPNCTEEAFTKDTVRVTRCSSMQDCRDTLMCNVKWETCAKFGAQDRYCVSVRYCDDS